MTASLRVKAPDEEKNSLLKLEDTRTNPSSTAQVEIYAYEPDEIMVHVNEYILVGEKAVFEVELFWKKHKLHGFNDDVRITSDFQLQPEGLLLATHKMVGELKVQYKGLSVTKSIHAYLPMKMILPENRIVLPPDESFQMKVVGGSGYY